jgi:calcineurin-like phosphoesterase family protein
MSVAFPSLIARRLPRSLYRRSIRGGLNRALKRTRERRTVDVHELRAVIFSDHHRGRGDGADDFRRCEQAYAAALGWYLEAGYELWLLGDVEELWENRPRDVLERYGDILRLEREFAPRLVRFFGNHDMAWRNEGTRAKYLDRWLRHVPVRETLTLVLTHEGQPRARLFLLHGHQGTLDSGNLLVVPFSRLIVRFVWGTLQRAIGFASTSPATDAVLRGAHDSAMEQWADDHPERIILLAGHTHRPVFPGTEAPDRAAEARAAEATYHEAVANGEGIPAARAARELARVRTLRVDRALPPKGTRPCYFNTGCCSFGDGDVTGLELADGKVRLVRWLDDNGRPAAQCLAEADLSELFEQLAGLAPAAE